METVPKQRGPEDTEFEEEIYLNSNKNMQSYCTFLRDRLIHTKLRENI